MYSAKASCEWTIKEKVIGSRGSSSISSLEWSKAPSKLCWKNLEKRNNHRSFWICVWEKLGQGNHVIIVTSSFSKSSVFAIFAVHKKTQSRRFQIPPVWRAFAKSSVSFRDLIVWTVGLTVEIKLRFQILCELRLKSVKLSENCPSKMKCVRNLGEFF